MPYVAIIDTLNSLLDAERTSVFRFMTEGSPYLSRATVELRRPLQEMRETSHRHAQELARLIETLGGTPMPTGAPTGEEQYLAYLSLNFLLPKLIEAMELTIQRYENARKTLAHAPAEVAELLERHQSEHRAQLEVLQRAEEQLNRA